MIGRTPSGDEGGVSALGATASLSGGMNDEPDAAAERLKKSQNEMRRKMGLATLKERTPMGTAGEDLFQMVHLKYQTLRESSAFIETFHIVDAD